MSPAVTFLPLGAIIKSYTINGVNIVQSFPTTDLYQKHNSPFFGETIGRVANRIKNGKIDSLNKKSYDLVVNNGPNTLHGGKNGWGKQIWNGPTSVDTRDIPSLPGGPLKDPESVKFTLTSPDGDEGFPGAVEVSVIYTTGTQTSPNGKEVQVLAFEYESILTDDKVKETAVNITNHSYFNLAGADTAKTIEGTEITLGTNLYLPVDDTGIPTAGPSPYPGIEANEKFTLGAKEPDVDDCFAFPGDPASVPIDTRGGALKTLVAAYHPDTKIHLEVLSTDPGFQFYTGKYIEVPEVEHDDGKIPARGPRAAFCVEPSRFVNAVNVDEWKAQVLLRKGEVYGSRHVYRAWCDV